MIAPDLDTIARRKLALEARDRDEVLAQEISTIKERLSARGALFSGMTEHAVMQCLQREYAIRASRIFQTYAQLIGSSGVQIDAVLASELKTAVRSVLAETSAGIEKQHTSLRRLLSGITVPPLEPLADRAAEQVSADIDIAVLTARPQASRPESGVTIYQNFGIVQTGESSAANYTYLAESGAKEALAQALDELLEALNAARDVTPLARAEIVEVVDDTKKELQRPTPNLHRIRGLLAGIASTVQTLGSAKAAYDLLKGAAAPFGIHLP